MSDKNLDITLNVSEAKYFVLKYLIILKYYKDSNGKSYKKTQSFITTNQIRKFLSAFIKVSNQIKNSKLSSNSINEQENNNTEKCLDASLINDIEYMNIQLVYLVGRNKQNNYEVNIRSSDKEDVSKNEIQKKEIDEHINPNSNIVKELGDRKGVEALYMRIQKKIEYIINNKKEKDFDELYKYIEAIVAYHKFYDVEGE